MEASSKGWGTDSVRPEPGPGAGGRECAVGVAKTLAGFRLRAGRFACFTGTPRASPYFGDSLQEPDMPVSFPTSNGGYYPDSAPGNSPSLPIQSPSWLQDNEDEDEDDEEEEE
jgi:hypothetical protein